jgi:hypothetical protein
LSNNESFHNLSFKISKPLLKELNTELVFKYGKTYGNMAKTIREAIKQWVDKEREIRIKN